MIIDALRRFFLTCPYFAGRDVNVNFLNYKEGDCSIDQLGDCSVIRRYTDGATVRSCDFCLAMRCGFDADTTLNLQDAELFEKIAAWITAQSSRGILPDVGEGIACLGLEIQRMPSLAEASVQGARIELVLRLIYKEF